MMIFAIIDHQHVMTTNKYVASRCYRDVMTYQKRRRAFLQTSVYQATLKEKIGFNAADNARGNEFESAERCALEHSNTAN